MNNIITEGCQYKYTSSQRIQIRKCNENQKFSLSSMLPQISNHRLDKTALREKSSSFESGDSKRTCSEQPALKLAENKSQ
jgi:hypothetical protein